MSDQLPEPRLTLVYRLEATLGEPLDLGESAQGHRRIVPQTGGTFRGPEIAGKLLAGASADWQIVLPDGTALADIRYTLQTDDGALLYVRSRGVRHGSPEVLARLARGEDVDASEYTFRTTAQIETAAPELDWLNKGVFIGVGGRRPAGVIYETYLVDESGVTMPDAQKVAIITGASQGIGAGLVAGFRQAGYAVVGTSRTIRPPTSPATSRCRVTSAKPRRPSASWNRRSLGSDGSTA